MKKRGWIYGWICLASIWCSAQSYPNIKINNDTTTQIQNEEQIICNPANGDNVVAVWRDFRLGYRRVGIGSSFDGGNVRFQGLLEDDHYMRHSDPGITVDRWGNFYIVFLGFSSTSEPNGLFVQKSTNGGLTWSTSTTVVDGVSGVFEDKELIACDRSGGMYDGYLYVVWARFGWDIQIMCARSIDGGSSFQSPVVLDSGSLQWPSPAVGPNGELYVAWENFYEGLKIRRSDDGGETFSPAVVVDSEATYYNSINGGIDVFSYPAIDVDISNGPHRGRVHIAYMADTPSSGTDIFYRYSDDGGMTWSDRVRVNDDFPGRNIDQFHPWLAVSRNTGETAIMFYDRRNDPGNLLMDVYWTRFDGESWTQNERITTVSSDPTAGKARTSDIFFDGKPGPNRSGLIGEYNGLCACDNGWNLIWTDTREGNQDVFTAPVRYATPEPTSTQIPSTPTPSPTPPCIHDGDVDANGSLTPQDALMTFNIYLGAYPNPSYQERCAADCNADSAVTPADALCIFRNYIDGSCNCME